MTEHVPITTGQQLGRRSWAEPWKIKMVEPLWMSTRPERERALAEAGYNTFLLRSEDVYIDLLTDSGTNAMSDRQWAGMMLGDEAYAGSRNFYHLEAAVQRFYGYEHVVPTHQGRGAEHLISQIAIEPGQYVPGNMYFTTTRLHQERAGGVFVDVIRDEAHDPESLHPFKGDVDLDKLEALVAEHGAERIAYVSLAGTVNMAGGQPVSMANVKALRELCDRHGIRLFLDATRMVENAWFIQEREEGYADSRWRRSCSSSAPTRTAPGSRRRRTASSTSAAGSRSATRSSSRRRATSSSSSRACTPTAASRGATWRRWRSGSRSRYRTTTCAPGSARSTTSASSSTRPSIPFVRPVGGHAIFLDARRFYPHLEQDLFPAQTLAAELYLDSGIRSMERGIVSAGRDPETGDHQRPALELTRLTIPRRVYTQAHMDVVAESVESVYAAREQARGLRMTYEPRYLRFFQARFEPL